jgi:hypothetical protein
MCYLLTLTIIIDRVESIIFKFALAAATNITAAFDAGITNYRCIFNRHVAHFVSFPMAYYWKAIKD